MTPLRIVGVAVLAFAIALPAGFRKHGAGSGPATSSEAAEDDDQNENEDPVVNVLCLKGLNEMSRGKFTQAAATYTKAINRDPNYSDAYLGRGDAYRAAGELDKALADYEHAAHLDPNNEDARDRLEDARKAKAER